jgi:hypothetical protein
LVGWAPEILGFFLSTLTPFQTYTPLGDNRAMRLHDYAPRFAHLKWLLDSDPAIRWQVMLDRSVSFGILELFAG